MDNLRDILGTSGGALVTFGVSRTTDGITVASVFPAGTTMAVAAGFQLVVLGGSVKISGSGGTIRVDNQAGAALGPTITVSGNGQYAQMDLPPIILDAGDEIAITTGGSGSGTLYGYGYIRAV